MRNRLDVTLVTMHHQSERMMKEVLHESYSVQEELLVVTNHSKIIDKDSHAIVLSTEDPAEVEHKEGHEEVGEMLRSEVAYRLTVLGSKE